CRRPISKTWPEGLPGTHSEQGDEAASIVLTSPIVLPAPIAGPQRRRDEERRRDEAAESEEQPGDVDESADRADEAVQREGVGSLGCPSWDERVGCDGSKTGFHTCSEDGHRLDFETGP